MSNKKDAAALLPTLAALIALIPSASRPAWKGARSATTS